jgi:hypothetical protein
MKIPGGVRNELTASFVRREGMRNLFYHDCLKDEAVRRPYTSSPSIYESNNHGVIMTEPLY